MDQERDHMNQRYELPLHRPSMDLWDRIEGELDFLDMVQIYGLNVTDLPEHGPDHLTWQNIEDRLPVTPVYERTYFKVSRTILALGLLVFFAWVISRLIPGTQQQSVVIPSENDIKVENAITKASQQEAADFKAKAAAKSGESATVTSGAGESKEIAVTTQSAELSRDANGNSSHEQTANITPVVSGRNPAGEYLPSSEKSGESGKVTNSAAEQLTAAPEGRSGDGRTGTSGVGRMAIFRAGNIDGSTLTYNVSTDTRDNYYTNKFRTIEIGFNDRLEYNELPSAFPKSSYISNTLGLNLRLGFKGFFVETGLGYKQYDVENQYGLDYYQLHLLGSVLVMNEYQIVQYVNDEGEVVVDKIYHPRLVNVYDTTATTMPTTASSHYKYLEIPVFIGTRLYSRSIWSLNVITGARLNFPLKTTEILPEAAGQSYDYVNIERVATMRSQFYAQFFAGIENRFLINNWLNFNLEPSFSYSSQKMTMDNKIVGEQGFSFGIRAGLSIIIK